MGTVTAAEFEKDLLPVIDRQIVRGPEIVFPGSSKQIDYHVHLLMNSLAIAHLLSKLKVDVTRQVLPVVIKAVLANLRSADSTIRQEALQLVSDFARLCDNEAILAEALDAFASLLSSMSLPV